ncbi:hypothetical protein LB519_25150 [Mesorhizobium sp. AD1-1]|nr:hypothetical protein [Mesorhizobium sp. AD1-1]MBZ9721133.1 hypothetical protein [Mesorhizobium sp. AD1-1]
MSTVDTIPHSTSVCNRSASLISVGVAVFELIRETKCVSTIGQRSVS